jgi:hypothetical protein
VEYGTRRDASCERWARASSAGLGLRLLPRHARSTPGGDRAAGAAPGRVQALSIISIDSTKWFDQARPNVTLKTDLDEVVLGDTTRVEDPRDLLPAVLPESPTARLIAAYEQDVHEATIIKVVVSGSGAVAFAASVALSIAGAAAAQQRLPDAGTLTTFGVLLSVPAVVAIFFGALLPITPPSSTRASAFSRYNEDLAQRLGLR